MEKDPMPSPAARWLKLVSLIDGLLLLVLPENEPQCMTFPYPGEGWKDRAEREAMEEKNFPQTVESLEQFLRTKKWPKTSATVGFFARERLQFARRMAAALATPAQPFGDSPDPNPIPTGRNGATIRWLAIDLYDAGHFPLHRWCNDVQREY